MNEFLGQFLIESRELVQQATEDLLALEASPQDKTLIDGVFRGFHTLKGAAGIVDFPAMARMLHAAEDVLAAVRAGARPASAELIGDCLACLHQVVRWLDGIETDGEVPAAPEAAADALAARFGPAVVPPTAAPVPPGWVETLLSRHVAQRGLARVALRHQPADDGFFRGEDPLDLIARLPGLLALDAAPARPWPSLGDFDPFTCNLIITALAAGSPDEVVAAARPASGQIEIQPLAGSQSAGEADLSPEALAVLREQMLMVAGDEAETFAGRLGSAARVAINVLRRAGRSNGNTLTRALDRSLRDGNAAAFADAIQSLLRHDPGPAVGDIEDPVPRRSVEPTVSERMDPAPRPAGAAAREAERPASRPAGVPSPEATGLASPPNGPAAASEAAPAAGDTQPQPRHGLGDALLPQSRPGDVDGPVEPGHDGKGDAEAPPPAVALRALRVDVARIDTLVALTGELTVAKNAIGHVTRLAQERADPEGLARMLKDQHALLDRLVRELHRSVLAIRVLPLRHVFQRFPRLVREMARDLGKSVRLVTEGETTEADKAIVEALFEPVLHVLRNALDHGIEPEAERRAAGKDATSVLRLRAVRGGDLVIVEVTDDGRGIDTAELRRVAARQGIASAEALARMTDAAAVELIFAPGFSTAGAVTGLSGRGVGMDAVRSAIARMGGRVAVDSQPGRGTTVRFTLPFTVMIVQVMTVEVAGQVFGIPIDAVVETVRIPRDRISRLGAAEAFVHRDRTVSLVRLSGTLDLPASNRQDEGRRTPDVPESHLPAPGPTAPATPDEASTDARIVVVSVAGQIGALEVDGFGERMDVMLKPMEGLLAGMGGFAGTTVLGDGRVLIVLDLQELLRCEESARYQEASP